MAADPTHDPSTEPRARRALLLLGLATFFHMGGLQATYGPAFAALQARFGVGLAEVGTSVGAHFLGGFAGVLAAGVLLARVGYRPLMVGSASLMAAGAAAIALAPVWSLALVGAGVIGLGYGLAVVLYNFLFARTFAPRGAAAVNLINGTFGVGAVLYPALVGLATGALVARSADAIAAVTPLVFGGAALLAVGLAVAVTRVPGLPAAPASGRRTAGRAPVAAVALFGGLLFVYIASEVGISAWAPTHAAEQVGVARGALAASVFWVAMTVGRFAAAAVAGAVPARHLVLGAVTLALGGLLLAAAPGQALVGYAVAGLALGPVFPTTLVWLQQRFGERAERVGPLVLAVANLGAVVGAPAVGVVVAAVGASAIPIVLALVVGVLLAIVAVVGWGDRRAGGA